jgi:peptidoglycan/xylan/chitin deacetylase (PgdA/CDA1 family)
VTAVFAIVFTQQWWIQQQLRRDYPVQRVRDTGQGRQVKDITVTDTHIQGTLKEPLPDGRRLFVANRVEPTLAERLAERGVTVTGAVESTLLRDVLSWILPVLFFFGLWAIFFRRLADRQGMGGMMTIGRSKAKVYLSVALVLLASSSTVRADGGTPILVYHRFGPVVADSMTVRTTAFERQLELMTQQGYAVVSLRTLVDHVRSGPPLPDRSVVITVDDGHRSVYTEMLPVIVRHCVPVTLFIYPSAVSRATYALTWEQLRALAATGLVDIQSHTYWHPNFAQERRRLSPVAYEHLVVDQLTRSRDTLQRRLETKVDMLSWPFGIYDDQLIAWASRAGYVAAVTLDRRHATAADAIMALPRYLVTDADTGARFQALLHGHPAAQEGGRIYAGWSPARPH